jgi:2',3'-cyclic-nucleotide 2'-phosphodiesterase/3'-nucleotidase
MRLWIRFALFVLLAGIGAVQAKELRLRLMATTDLHMHLLAHDYYRDQATDQYGFALTLGLIEQAKREAPNHLLFDNGDLLQGSPLGDQVAADGIKGSHPAYRVLRDAGFDAASVGNHEFNYGLSFLQRAVESAGFPVLSANVVWPKSQKPVFRPSVVLRRTFTDERGRKVRMRIGVVGLTPPQIMVWDHRHLAGRVEALDMVSVAQEEVAALRRAGVDLVVLLAHTGIDLTGRNATEQAGKALAKIPGVDALILGHAHAELPGPSYEGIAGIDAHKGLVHGVPAVMAGRWGDHLGLIDLRLTRSGNGTWKVVQADSQLRKVKAPPSSRPAALVEVEHRATQARMQGVLAHTQQALLSHWAQVQDSLSVEVVARAQAWHASQVLRGTEWESLPLVSAAAPFRTGGSLGAENYTFIEPGPLTRRHVADLYVYPNSFVVVKISGRELREWLERSAAQFRQIDPQGNPAQLVLATDHPGYNFDVIEGVTYDIDVTQPRRYNSQGELVSPSAQRIVNLRRNGQPVADGDSFAMVTNSYRASGGGRFPGLGPSKVIVSTDDDVRDIVTKYLATVGTLHAPADGNWQLLPVPGVALQVRSAARVRERVSAPWRWSRDEENGWAVYELPAAP